MPENVERGFGALAGLVAVAGPRLDGGDLLGLADQLSAQPEKADLVVCFHWSLVDALRQRLLARSVAVPVAYFYDLVDWSELESCTSFIWQLARTWFEQPQASSLAGRYNVGDCHWGFLDELSIASHIAEQVRHIVCAEAMRDRFPVACFAVYSSELSFLDHFQSVTGARTVFTKCLVHDLPGHQTAAKASAPRQLGRVLELLTSTRDSRRDDDALARDRPKVWLQWHRNTEPALRSRVLCAAYAFYVWRAPKGSRVAGTITADGARLVWGLRRLWCRIRVKFGRRGLSSSERQGLADLFSFHGVSFFDQIRYVFERLAPERVAALQVLTEEIAASLSVRPKAVLTCGYVSAEQKLLAHHGRRLGIPTVAIQHGLMTNSKLSADRVYTDWYAAWGPREAEEFERCDPANRGKVVPVGSCLHDVLNRSPLPAAERERLRDQFRIPPTGKVIALFPAAGDVAWDACEPYDAAERTMGEALAGLQEIAGTFVVVKVHPLSQVPVEKFVPDSAKARVRVLRDANAYDVIRASEVVIGHISTVGADALVLGKPFVVFEPYGLPASQTIPYADYGVAQLARGAEELRDKVERLLSDPEARQRQLLNRDRYFADYLILDGRADARLETLIERLDNTARPSPVQSTVEAGRC